MKKNCVLCRICRKEGKRFQDLPLQRKFSLHNFSYTSHSNYVWANALPEELSEILLEEAHERPGYAVWNTDYCNSYGLLFRRESYTVGLCGL